MKTTPIYYAIRTLLRGYDNGLIKICTLTLGLTIGLVLLARVSFDLSYDRFLPDAKRIYQIQSLFTNGLGSDHPDVNDYGHTFRPLAPTMAEELPGVEAGCSLLDLRGEERVVFGAEGRYVVEPVYADSALFRTLGLKVLKGNTGELMVKDRVFISRSLAERMFSEGDEVGQTLYDDKARRERYVVAGVFDDIPANSHLRFDFIYSIALTGQPRWDGGDGFTGYVRLRPDASAERVASEMTPLLERHMDLARWRERGMSYAAYLKPVLELHVSEPEIRQTLAVLSILATLILAASAFNYVMLSVSSLAKRARVMAIHKCFGATFGDIFRTRLVETALLVVASAALAAFLIAAAEDGIVALTGVPLSFFLSGRQVAVSLGAILLVVLLAGLLPARIFASVPAARVFRFYDLSRRGGRKILLGAQIASSSFMLVFLAVVLLQYGKILDKDLGYDPSNLVYVTLRDPSPSDQRTAREELERLPEVERVCYTGSFVPQGFNGRPLINPATGESITTVRYCQVDSAFISTLGLQLKMGDNLDGSGGEPEPALVNQRFLQALGWTEESAIGKVHRQLGIVVRGVVNDFTVGGLFDERTPIFLSTSDEMDGSDTYLTLRLHEITPRTLTKVEHALRDLFPDDDIVVRAYRDDLQKSYRDTTRFRDSALVAALFMTLITLMGLLGYVADEIRRRGKEIMVRKICGATAWDIERLLLLDLASAGLPAIVLALLAVPPVAHRWLMSFPERVHLGFALYLLSGLSLAGLLAATVVLRGWRKANENPSIQLQVEK